MGCVGIGVAVAVGADVRGRNVGISVGGSVGVTANVAASVGVGGTGGVAARDRSSSPPAASNANTITPATRPMIRHEDFRTTG